MFKSLVLWKVFFSKGSFEKNTKEKLFPIEMQNIYSNQRLYYKTFDVKRIKFKVKGKVFGETCAYFICLPENGKHEHKADQHFKRLIPHACNEEILPSTLSVSEATVSSIMSWSITLPS